MDKQPFPELGLAPELLNALQALGFEQPTPVQARAIPPALEGRDIVGQSQTGSGKTMAFAIPAVQMLDPNEKGVRVLILCPTRELAIQVCEAIHQLAVHKPGVRATPIYGGASYERQIRSLRDGAQIVVGTPGRILDFLRRGLLRLDALRMLVFDEADEMLDRGFRDEIDELTAALPPERQTLFFSATLAGPIRELIDRTTRDAAEITIDHKALTVPTVEQWYLEVHSRSKIEVLCRIFDIENPRLAMVFANTKRAVDDITDKLLARGYSADRLHGDLNQMMRDRVMRNFRSGTIEILVCTDVAARGIDVDDVDLVVNYDLPYDEEDYVHRIGRTGRAGKSGKAVSLVSGRDIYLLQRIQRYAKVRVERHKVPTREDVEGRRADARFERLRSTLEEGAFTSHEDTIQRLLDAGHTPTDISSAIMHLWLGESSRESEAIIEDKPKPPRRERAPDAGRRDPAAPGQPSDRPGEPARPPRERQDRRDAASARQEGFTRMFLNLGAIDQVGPREIAGAVYNTTGIPAGALGRIEIYGKCSYVGVKDEFVDHVGQAMSDASWRGRRLRMNTADELDSPAQTEPFPKTRRHGPPTTDRDQRPGDFPKPKWNRAPDREHGDRDRDRDDRSGGWRKPFPKTGKFGKPGGFRKPGHGFGKGKPKPHRGKPGK